jgi:acetyltransferase EpsM
MAVLMKEVVIVGGLGSGVIAHSVFTAVAEEKGEWEVKGMLSDVDKNVIKNINILGKTNEINDFIDCGYHIHYTLHFNAKNKEKRYADFLELNIPSNLNASAVHPSSRLAKDTIIGNGVCIASGVSTSPGVKLGDNCHLYDGSFVGHDTTLAEAITISARSVIGGRILINDGVHIGLNSTIREDITIGQYSILGAGAMLTKNIPKGEIWAGNPARFLKKLEN